MATIQGVYVALFGRPADPAGLAYFNSITNGGQNLAGIASLAGTKEYTDRFAGQSNLAIVNSIYQSLFNRDAEAAGLNFFVDALNKGTLNINNIAIAILDGAAGTDKTTAANKIAAADAFTKALDTPVEVAAYSGTAAAAQGRAFLAPVTSAASTIPTAAATDAAIVTLTSVATGGVSITTDGTAAQAVSLTATDAKFKSTGGDDTITASAITSGTTKIDAGLGSDTLNATIGLTGGTLATGTIANVEKLFLTVTNGATNGEAMTAPLDLVNVKGLQQVWNNASADDFAVTNINSGAVLGIQGTVTGSTAFSFADLPTAPVTLNLKGVTSTSAGETVAVNGATAVNLVVDGNSTVVDFEATSASSLTISGKGNLTIDTSATGLDAISKIDASALDGKLVLDLTGVDRAAGTSGVTVSSSKNVDSITLEAAGFKDVVVVSAAETSRISTVEKINTFVVTGGEDKLNLAAFNFGAKTAVTNFSAAPVEGATFESNSGVGFFGGNVYIDSNNDGKVNLATDVVLSLSSNAAGTTAITSFTADNVIWA